MPMSRSGRSSRRSMPRRKTSPADARYRPQPIDSDVEDALAAAQLTLSDDEIPRLEEPYVPRPPERSF
jgi:hypothetical protein